MRMPTTMSFAAIGALLSAATMFAQAPAALAQDKTFTMKLSTATVNDTQHEWLKRFAAAVEKNSGGRIKGEVYAASQLGSIQRQIEGVQFGSIQVWMGPPEFLVGVDERYEAMVAPGLFTTHDQVMKVMEDPEAKKLVYGLGSAKGIAGVGFATMSPSTIVTKKPVKQLSDLKGMKIRVLASQFQLEFIRRLDASPIAMTLGDVLPALQQGTIDGALGSTVVWATMHYYDVAKYTIEVEQPFVNSLAVVSKRWMESLPPDLQKVVMDSGEQVSSDFNPFVKEFTKEQQKIWTDHGGETTALPKDVHDAMIAKVSSIGDDMSKSKPGLNQTVKALFDIAKRVK